jgi:hypothetical protein
MSVPLKIEASAIQLDDLAVDEGLFDRHWLLRRL